MIFPTALLSPFLRRFRSALLLGVAVALLFQGVAMAQQQMANFSYPNPKGTRVVVQSVFGGTTTSGCLPVRVTITNKIAKEHSWRLAITAEQSDYRGGSIRIPSEFEFTAPPNADSSYTILVPIPPALGQNDNSIQYRMKLSSPNLKTQDTRISLNFSDELPSIGMSESLFKKSGSELKDRVDSETSNSYLNPHFGVSFKPEHLPDDWRGYVGIDAMMLTVEEWEKLPAGVRKALREWVGMGGRLDLYTLDLATRPPDIDFPEAGKKGTINRPELLGRFGLLEWNGKELAVISTYDRITSAPKRRAALKGDFVGNNWGLRKAFGFRDFNPQVVIIALILFGIVVGPVNLFTFAGPGKRHRLFFTTPLISLIASLILGLLIFLGDGLGGSGMRITTLGIAPEAEDRRVYVRQEQIVRTGLMLGTSFKIDDPSSVTPVLLQASRWARISQNSGGRNRLRVENGTYSGDWFQSRSEHGQVTRLAVPTRVRIEHGAEPSQLVSRLDFELEGLAYVDASGQFWFTEGKVAPGSEPVLPESDRKAVKAWWEKQTLGVSNTHRAQLMALLNGRSVFIGVSRGKNPNVVDAAPGIEWDEETVLVYGKIFSGNEPPPEPASSASPAGPENADAARAKEDVK